MARDSAVGHTGGGDKFVDERGGNLFKKKKRVGQGQSSATHKKGWDMDPDLFLEFDKHRKR
tara:strand:+ start:328 stop:510 length:183 start_codon:yes stop_codon:yes gene_type:complete